MMIRHEAGRTTGDGVGHLPIHLNEGVRNGLASGRVEDQPVLITLLAAEARQHEEKSERRSNESLHDTEWRFSGECFDLSLRGTCDRGAPTDGHAHGVHAPLTSQTEKTLEGPEEGNQGLPLLLCEFGAEAFAGRLCLAPVSENGLSDRPGAAIVEERVVALDQLAEPKSPERRRAPLAAGRVEDRTAVGKGRAYVVQE